MIRTLIVAAIVAVGGYYTLQASFFGLLLYLWNAYFRPTSWVWDGVFASTDLSFPIAVVLLSSVALRERLRLVPRGGLLALFLIVGFVSTLDSYYWEWSWYFFVALAKTLVIAYMIALLTTDHHKFRLVMLTIALSLGLEAAKQGWVEALRHPGAMSVNIHPVLGDNNGVGMGMIMLLPIFGALAQTATTKWERHMHQFLLVGVLLRALSTYSRGAFLAAAAIGFMFIVRGQQRIRLLAAMLLIGTLSLSMMPQTFWDRMGTIVAPAEARDASQLGRLHFWRVALDMAAARPLFGVGVNGYQTAYNEFDDTDRKFGEQRAVHSAWFGLVAEVGIPGLTIFLTLLVSAFLTCQRVRSLGKTCEEIRPLVPFATAIEMSLVGFVVGGTFLNAQYSELYWHLVGCTLAMHALAAAAVPRQVVKGAGILNHVGRPQRAPYEPVLIQRRHQSPTGSGLQHESR